MTETMSTPSSSGSSSGSSRSAEQFEAFWRQLKDCHLNALEGMNANPLHFIFPMYTFPFNPFICRSFRTGSKSKQVEKRALSVSVTFYALESEITLSLFYIR